MEHEFHSKSPADRLRVWRLANGLNPESAGELLRVTGRTVRNIEAGRSRPDLALAVRIDRKTNGFIPVSDWVEEQAA